MLEARTGVVCAQIHQTAQPWNQRQRPECNVKPFTPDRNNTFRHICLSGIAMLPGITVGIKIRINSDLVICIGRGRHKHTELLSRRRIYLFRLDIDYFVHPGMQS